MKKECYECQSKNNLHQMNAIFWICEICTDEYNYYLCEICNEYNDDDNTTIKNESIICNNHPS